MQGYSFDPFISLKLFLKLLAQKWALCRKINVYAPLHEAPHSFSTTYRQNFVEWWETKKMKTIFSRRAPRSRKEEKNTGFTSRVSGFRLLNFGSRFLTPDSWILFFPLFFPEMGEKGRPHDPFNISFFYGRSKENLEEAVWEEAKITPQREGDETLGGSCGFFRCRKKVFFPDAPREEIKLSWPDAGVGYLPSPGQ